MHNLSLTSVFDVQLSSEDEEEDEEINLMARCVEMEMSAPIPIPWPSYDPSFFSLGKENGTISRDDRLRNGHPITLCRNLVPMVETTMSPPPQERGPAYGLSSTRFCDTHGYQHKRPQQNMDVITNYSQGMEPAGTNSLSGYSDCLVCGKSVEQIKDQAVIVYLHKTAQNSNS